MLKTIEPFVTTYKEGKQILNQTFTKEGVILLLIAGFAGVAVPNHFHLHGILATVLQHAIFWVGLSLLFIHKGGIAHLRRFFAEPQQSTKLVDTMQDPEEVLREEQDESVIHLEQHPKWKERKSS